MKSRDHALDALRGIAILSVVLGHSLVHTGIGNPPGWIGAAVFFVYLYNVQVFGFASGYVLKRLSIAHKAATLLIPLLTSIVLNAAVGEGRFLENLPTQFHAALSGSGMWFLWALFLGFCLFAVLRKQWVLVIAAILIGAAWSFIPTWTAEAPFAPAKLLGLFRTMGLVFPYMVLGALWRRYEKKGLRLRWPVTIGALIGLLSVAAALTWIQRTVLPTSLLEVRALMVGYWSLQMVGSALACIGFLGVCRLLKGPVLLGLAFFGVLSLGIYQFHPILIARFPVLFQPQTVLEIPLRIGLLLAVSVALTYLVSLNKYSGAAFLGGRVMFPKPWMMRQPDVSAKAVKQAS